MTNVQIYVRPFTDPLAAELCRLTTAIFGDLDTDDLVWRLQEMPDASVHAIASDERLIAFKFGYAIGRWRYLSWLGGVDPRHRRQGLARRLCREQHAWAQRRGYRFVETGAIESNAPMLSLNISEGFKVIGTYQRSDVPRVVLQKRLEEPEGSQR